MKNKIKLAKILIIFTILISMITISFAANVNDYINNNLEIKEIIQLESENFSIMIPENSYGFESNTTNYTINKNKLNLNCLNKCEISFTIKNSIIQKKDYLEFSKNINAINNYTYELYLPQSYVINSESNDKVIPNSKTITTDGEKIIIKWAVNHPEIKRYYVSFLSHENIETKISEFKEGFLESENIITFLIVFIIALGIGIYIGHSLKKEKEVKVVLQNLLSPDEKKLLKEIENHFKEEKNKISQKDLGKRLNWSKSKVSSIITLLVQKDLVEKEKVGRNYLVITKARVVKD